MFERPLVLGSLGLAIIGAALAYGAVRPRLSSDPEASPLIPRSRPSWDLRVAGLDRARFPVMCALFAGHEHACAAVSPDAESRPVEDADVDGAPLAMFFPDRRALCRDHEQGCVTAGEGVAAHVKGVSRFRSFDVTDDLTFINLDHETWSVERDAPIFSVDAVEKRANAHAQVDGDVVAIDLVGDDAFAEWVDVTHGRSWWGAMDPVTLAPRGPVRPDGGSAWIAIAPHLSMQVTPNGDLRTFQAVTGATHVEQLPPIARFSPHPGNVAVMRLRDTAFERSALVIAVDERGGASTVWYDVHDDGSIALHSVREIHLGVVWTSTEAGGPS